MADIADITADNDRACSELGTMTAVFTGATHGIGLATLKAFVKHTPNPTAYIVGRDKDAFAVELQKIQALNDNATLVFLETQLSLIQSTDTLCDHLQRLLPKRSVRLLYMSAGYAPLGARKFTAEGLDEAMTLACYGRVRLASELSRLDVLAANAVVLSILGGGKEGHLFEDDLELTRNYALINLRGHFTTLMTLAFDALAQRHPHVGFVHIYPGNVATGLSTRSPGGTWWFRLLLWVREVVLSFSAITPEEAGERMLHVALADRFARGSWSLDADESASRSEDLTRYRERPEVTSAVWNHMTVLFDRASSG